MERCIIFKTRSLRTVCSALAFAGFWLLAPASSYAGNPWSDNLMVSARDGLSALVMTWAAPILGDWGPIETQVRRQRIPKLIAKAFGNTQDEFLLLNNLDSNAPLEPGTMVYVLPRRLPRHERHMLYLVHHGDTWESVALRHNVRPYDLIAWNWRLDARRLVPGTALRIHKEHRVRFHDEEKEEMLVWRRWRQLPDGLGYRTRTSQRAWGTASLIKLLERSLGTTRLTFPEAPTLQVGDISHRRGGPIQRHMSHQVGRDVDVGYFLKTDKGDDDSDVTWRFHVATPESLDAEKTWFLLDQLIRSGKVKLILLDYHLQKPLYEHAKAQGLSNKRLQWLFQYPRPIHARGGLIHHFPGHADHFHVRIRCQPSEQQCEEPDDDD